MKWIVLWITLFLAWVMVFVATPRLALLGSGSSLDNLGNGIGHVGNPTGSPVEFQADPVGRITVAAQPPASAGDSQSRTGTSRCRPAVIRLTQPWRRAKEPVYVASFGAFTPDFEVEPNEHWKQLGEHRTSSILEASTEVETSCDASTCRTCVVAITAPYRVRAERNSAARGPARGLLCAGADAPARTAARSGHTQSPEDGSRGGETESCVGKGPAGGTREPRQWKRSRGATDHGQGRAGPGARTAESRGLLGQGERSPGPSGAIPERESTAMETVPQPIARVDAGTRIDMGHHAGTCPVHGLSS